MQEQKTSRRALEQLNLSLNAEGNPSKEDLNSQILEIEPIEKTPFSLLGTKENGYCIVLGKYIITESFPTKQDVKKYLKENQWNLMTNLIITMFQILTDEKTMKEINEETIRNIPQG